MCFGLGWVAAVMLNARLAARALDANSADAEFQWHVSSVTDHTDANGAGIDSAHSSTLAATADGLPALSIRAEYNGAAPDLLTSSLAPAWYGDENNKTDENE